MFAKRVTTVTTKSVLEAIQSELLNEGLFPEVLITDNANCFLSQLMKDALKALNIQSVQISAYNPSGNLIEQAHRSLLLCNLTPIPRFPCIYIYISFILLSFFCR